VTHNLHVIRPADPHSADDLDVVRRLDALGNRAFLGPELDGAYPDGFLLPAGRARLRGPAVRGQAAGLMAA
jgi:hypothetical protein